VFEGTLPSSPVSAIGVIGQGGVTNPTGPTELRRVKLQVLCRERTYIDAVTKAELVYKTVAGKWNQLATLKGRLVSDHEVGPHYLDSNNNHVFSLNFTLFTVSSTV
jgi:hypothetical protein